MLFRHLIPSDIDLLVEIELDPESAQFTTLNENLDVSTLQAFIDSEHNLNRMNQLRLVFLLHAEKIGFLDLYDFNQQNGSAGVGIIVAKKHRQKGYASMAIQHFLKYLAPAFNIHKVFAQVAQNNEISHMLFSKNGFVNETPNESIATFTFYIKTEN